jgi:hypothetical protein
MASFAILEAKVSFARTSSLGSSECSANVVQTLNFESPFWGPALIAAARPLFGLTARSQTALTAY